MKSQQKISVIIADDEPLARHGLREILKEEPGIHIVAESCDGEEAVRHLRQFSPDLLFLDIQMPGLDGFEVLRRVPLKKLPLIVFVTAYDEFAVKAFSEQALDYILKPFDSERIRSSLFRVRSMLKMKEHASYAAQIMATLRSLTVPRNYSRQIAIKKRGNVYFVNVDEIYWIESAADYLRLHTISGIHTIRETLNAIETQLDPSKFVRIHRSSIVRLNSIRELVPMPHGEYQAVLDNGKKLTVSRTYKEKLSILLG